MPILAKLDIPGLFFISTQHIINPRNWLTFARERSKNQWKTFSEIPDNIAKDLYDGISKNQLKLALKKYPNIEIGCHTISHPELPNLSQKELENEVLTSKKYLEDIVNKEVIYFAYPRGIYKKRELKFVKKHFFAAFSVDNYAKNDPFQIPRISIHSSNTSYLNIKFSPLHKPPFTL